MLMRHRHETPATLSPPLRILSLAGLLAVTGLGASPISIVRGTSEITIPAGTALVGTLTEPVSTKANKPGDRVDVQIAEPLRIDDDTYLPAGMVLSGTVTEAEQGGRVRSRAELKINFDRLRANGREYRVSTEPLEVVGKSETKNSAKKAIGGAVAGGVVGAILGNTKKGILIGAAAGTGVAVATKGGHIELPEGQRIQVRLTEPVTVRTP
jgi:hypothetical protein